MATSGSYSAVVYPHPRASHGIVMGAMVLQRKTPLDCKLLHFFPEVIKKYDTLEMALFIVDTGTNEHCRNSTQYDLKLTSGI